MLTRRDIRVKVMQTLYGAESFGEKINPEKTKRILIKNLDNAKGLPVFLLYFLIKICEYADKEAQKRAQKYLPTESDLSFNTKLAENRIVLQLLENNSFIEALKLFKTKYQIDDDVVRRSFESLMETEVYNQYIGTESRENGEEKNVLKYILDELMLDNDEFIGIVEKEFIHYQDDIEPALNMVADGLNHPAKANFLKPVGKEKLEFAKELLTTVIEKNDYCLELITPRLRNWEADRIAAIDMILLKMGVSEILYFESIPVKVTLNEYIELAKEYSTDRSSNFVNGILDSIYKDLNQQHKIKKIHLNKNFK